MYESEHGVIAVLGTIMARRPFVSTLTTQNAYIVIVTLYIQLQFISFVCFHLGKCPQAIACWVSTILFVKYDNDNQQLYIKHRTPDRHSKTGVKWTPSLAHFEQRFINGNKGAKCYKNCSKVSILFYSILTHWDPGKIAAISQTTFWNAFSWMKMF